MTKYAQHPATCSTCGYHVDDALFNMRDCPRCRDKYGTPGNEQLCWDEADEQQVETLEDEAGEQRTEYRRAQMV